MRGGLAGVRAVARDTGVPTWRASRVRHVPPVAPPAGAPRHQHRQRPQPPAVVDEAIVGALHVIVGVGLQGKRRRK